MGINIKIYIYIYIYIYTPGAYATERGTGLRKDIQW